jgi:type II secretory pathway pseudopilin PulG
MIASLVVVVILTLVLVGPLAWSIVRERRAERALALQADIQYAIDRRLGGTSYLMIHTEPPTLWHRGRVVLEAPRVAESLVDIVAPTALALTPSGYELVIALGPGSDETQTNDIPLQRAA